MPKPEEYRDKVIKLTREAGMEAMKYYDRDYSIEEKEDESPVTEADMASEKILIEELRKTGYGIVAEETGRLEGDREGVYWIVDPLDGTQDFIDKTGEFSIMVGLLIEGKPVFGVVYAPAQEKLWYASKGRGAKVVESGKRSEITVADKETLSDYELIASRNHFSDKDREISRKLGVSNVTRMGSLGIKFCSIAEGRADVAYYTTYKLGIWDACAPHVILEEAGGKVFDLGGSNLEYDLEGKKMDKGIVGIGGDAYDRVLETLRKNLDKLS